MIICSNCFSDKFLKAAISSTSQLEGKCGTCQEIGKLYNTETDGYLEDNYLSALLDIFTPVSQIPNYPREKGKLLQMEIAKNWSIFKTEDDSLIYEMLTSICKARFRENPALFEEKIGIKESIDDEYLKLNTLLKGQPWERFVEELKYYNRFHSKYLNLNIFKEYCFYLSKEHQPEEFFYRCRVADTEAGYSIDEMGSPPLGKSSDGRANARGVQILYLGDSDKTVIHETRAGQYDFVSIGKFKSKTSFVVVDFKSINTISPFEEDIIDNIKRLALNKEGFNKINTEMSKVMRRNDDTLDYLPTQYITDFIRSIVSDEGIRIYSGIEYKSVMNSSGYNLAVFDNDKFECIDVELKQIKHIMFNY